MKKQLNYLHYQTNAYETSHSTRSLSAFLRDTDQLN